MNDLNRRDWLAFAAAALAAGCAPARDPPIPAAPAAGSLDALAREKGLIFGSCLGTGPSGAPPMSQTAFEGTRAHSFDDPAIRALMISQCGMMVPENELKWYVLRPSADRFDFARADRLIAFAEKNGLAVRGHTLLWNSPHWFPAWLTDYDFASRAEAERMLREHISTVCRRYGTRIFAWDVVNETIDPDTGRMRDTVFTKYLGPDVIDIAFHAAREAAPGAQLVYNDFMSWGPGNAKHRAGVLDLLARLKKNGAPIDALGVQSHIGPGATDVTFSFGADDRKEWRNFLDTVRGMGLDVVITEFDVGDQTLPADITARDRDVAALARDYLDVMLSYPNLRYVMAWGLVDRYSWLEERWLRTDGLAKRPCPYDDDYRPKALREAIADAFRTAPTRHAMELG